MITWKYNYFKDLTTGKGAAELSIISSVSKENKIFMKTDHCIENQT